MPSPNPDRAHRARRSPAILLVLAGWALGGAAVARAEIIERVLAVVNGSLITLTDVTASRELGLVSPAGDADPVRAVLSALIDRTLELTEVDRYAPPEPGAEAIEREVEAVRHRIGGPQALDAVLARLGLDVQRLREWLRDDLRIRAYLDQRFLAGADRRQQLIADWIASLRRRAELTDIYLSER
jgi:hypothetical protein